VRAAERRGGQGDKEDVRGAERKRGGEGDREEPSRGRSSVEGGGGAVVLASAGGNGHQQGRWNATAQSHASSF
jgi:hypothetical protein